MKKFKHSKIKNTAILFELLSKQVTADVLSETSNKSLPMIRKYFNSKTELGKELACYHIVTEAIGKRESSANKILELAVQHRKRLDVKKLAREKYNLISELRTVYDIDMFFESRVSNYRLYAALYKMFEYDSSDNPTAHVESYETILEHMTSTPKANMISEGKKMYSESESPELQALTFKMIVEKFNKKYKNLSERQKQLINRFITENTSLEPFKNYFYGEVKSVRNDLYEIAKTVDDKSLRIKITESITLMNEMVTSKYIKDEHLSAMLKYYQLVDVLNG